MRVLVIDTNAFVQDFRMQGHAFSVLLSNVEVVADIVAIPQVVLDETVHKYSIAIDAVSRDIRALSKTTSRLLGSKFKFVEPAALSDANSEYATFLVEQFEGKCNVLDHPNTPHSELVKRAILKKKPFKETGSGYRDALIWETILEILGRDDQPSVIFVTNNKKDFWSEDDLAQDLLSDLQDREIARERVELFLTIDGLSKARILPHLNQLEELSEKIENDQIPGVDFGIWLQDTAFDAIDVGNVTRLLVGIEPGECSVELSEVYEVDNVSVKESFLLGESDNYLILAADVGVGINVCADRYEYEESSAITDLFDADGMGEPLPYACVSVGEIVRFEFSLLVHSYDPFNASIEVLSMSREPAGP